MPRVSAVSILVSAVVSKNIVKPILSLLLSPFCLPDVTVPVGVSLSRCIPKWGAPDVIKNTYEACQSPGEVFIRLKLDFKLLIIENILYETTFTTTNKF